MKNNNLYASSLSCHKKPSWCQDNSQRPTEKEEAGPQEHVFENKFCFLFEGTDPG